MTGYKFLSLSMSVSRRQTRIATLMIIGFIWGIYDSLFSSPLTNVLALAIYRDRAKQKEKFSKNIVFLIYKFSKPGGGDREARKKREGPIIIETASFFRHRLRPLGTAENCFADGERTPGRISKSQMHFSFKNSGL
jgi:hypothetical protein